MEDIILNDAVALTNAIESLAATGPIKNLHNITSVAVLNSLWTLVAGARYVAISGNHTQIHCVAIAADDVDDVATLPADSNWRTRD